LTKLMVSLCVFVRPWRHIFWRFLGLLLQLNLCFYFFPWYLPQMSVVHVINDVICEYITSNLSLQFHLQVWQFSVVPSTYINVMFPFGCIISMPYTNCSSHELNIPLFRLLVHKILSQLSFNFSNTWWNTYYHSKSGVNILFQRSYTFDKHTDHFFRRIKISNYTVF
jgi:hypothetical protein